MFTSLCVMGLCILFFHQWIKPPRHRIIARNQDTWRFENVDERGRMYVAWLEDCDPLLARLAMDEVVEPVVSKILVPSSNFE